MELPDDIQLMMNHLLAGQCDDVKGAARELAKALVLFARSFSRPCQSCGKEMIIGAKKHARKRRMYCSGACNVRAFRAKRKAAEASS